MTPINPSSPSLFIEFISPIEDYEIPSQFNYPFYYSPDMLSKLAASELQDYLISNKSIEHNFGLDPNKSGMPIGKMFGVLVVKDKTGHLGYLAAYSGKLNGKVSSDMFVPTVFDSMIHNNFLNTGMIELTEKNKEIDSLVHNPEYIRLQSDFDNQNTKNNEIIRIEREKLILGRKNRKAQRIAAKENLSARAYEVLLDQLHTKSIQQKFFVREYEVYLKDQINKIEIELLKYQNQIEHLKTERTAYSVNLQNKIFNQYEFLNLNKRKESLYEIFVNKRNIRPPAGSGECAAPKLLQYAYINDLYPIALAEFWWGKSPDSEIRKHKNFYPSCRGKCEPILGHMLEGIDVAPNPLLDNLAQEKKITIIYEDEYLLVINKPEELLSVPGKSIQDSVYTRIRQRYPRASGPLIVHRLDMSTSGVMLISKTKEINKELQRQFIKRIIKKRYLAVLDGIIEEDKGTIDLPLRLDIDDRPRQLVCYEHGKSARTHWEVFSRDKNTTRIHFHPITGRTHQLRVHAAHAMGLHSPIVGDDLYGDKGKRLLLHAESIEFIHPITHKLMNFHAKAPF